MSVIVTVPRNAVKPFPLHQVYFSSLVKILVGLAKGKKKKNLAKLPWPYPASRYVLLDLSSIVNNLK